MSLLSPPPPSSFSFLFVCPGGVSFSLEEAPLPPAGILILCFSN